MKLLFNTLSLLPLLAVGVHGVAQPCGPPDPEPNPEPSPGFQTSNYGCVDEPIDVCVVLDMSGSVCTPSGMSPKSCSSCSDDCHVNGYDRDICCPNFEATMTFAKDLASHLDTNINSATRFSLVTFATEVSNPTDLSSISSFSSSVNNLDYSGGWTDTGDAIKACHEKLNSSPNEKVMVLVTDGTPTNSPWKSPSYDKDHKTYATQRADAAKIDDITILPVLIVTVSADEDYLKTLGSTESSSTVTSFDNLHNELDAIAAKVACTTSSPPPPPPPPPVTCTNDSVELCVALDMSGSVCTPSGMNAKSCNSCSDDCYVSGYNRDTCCPNFEATMTFAKDLVEKIDTDIPNSKYSLVTFATSSYKKRWPTDSKWTFKNEVDGLDYSGGWTDTGDAIKDCYYMIKDSSKEKVIVLVTDGTPTNSPWSDPSNSYEGHKTYATQKADEAKNNGVTILPVLIESVSENEAYLSSLGSSATDTTVTTFENLADEIDGIADLVMCAGN